MGTAERKWFIAAETDIQSVEAGAYALRVGGAGGTVIEAERASREGVTELQRALEAPAPRSPQEEGGFAADVDEAAKATGQVERAVALCQGVAEGRALDLDQLGLEVGALLDCLEKLDRRKEHKKALRMARALATLLMLLKRWVDLLRTLRLALGLANQLGDLEAVAWAEHEIGTLRLIAGDIEGADRDLCEAKEIRERIGDRRGLAATNRNLQSLCKQLRQMVQNEELVRRSSSRPATARLALFAALFAFVFAIAGFAAGSLVGSDDSGESRAAAGGGNGDATGGGNGGGGGEGNNAGSGSGDGLELLPPTGVTDEGSGGTTDEGGTTDDVTDPEEVGSETELPPETPEEASAPPPPPPEEEAFRAPR